MAVLIVDGICRFSVNQRLFGRPCVNVLDMKIDSQDATFDRSDAILDQAKIIAKEWKNHVLTLQSTSLVLESVSYLDLDTADGTVGEFAGDTDIAMGVTGSKAGHALTPSTAILITKVTSGTRGTKSGRMYLAGMSEADNDAGSQNNVSGAFLDSVRLNLNTYLGAINQEAGISGVSYDSDLHVVHRTAGGVTSSSVVTSLAPQRLLATQRRRLRP